MPAVQPLADPTRNQFGAYAGAFDYFNAALFGGELPPCILNFSRRSKRTLGFFAPSRWARVADGAMTHEISLNPDVLLRPIRDTMGTLVHEMAHLWQEVHGRPSRTGYHNKEWAAKMAEIGLVPSNTGAPGGKRTGQQMDHYEAPGGPFAAAFEAMPPGLLLPWVSAAGAAGGKPKAPPKSKLKYTCLICHLNVWGAGGLEISCNKCGLTLACEG